MQLLLALAVLAQQPDTTRLPDVVTTASRLAERAGTVTGSHTVLRGEELRARGLVLLLDALRDVPGLVTVQTGSWGAAASLFLRGGESDYVKVLVDGVVMNSPGGAINLAHLTLDNVDRIEITRGSASVLYGADAMTGVVQIFTRAGTGPLRASVLLEAGSRASRRLGGALRGAGRAGSVAIEAGSFGNAGLYPFNASYRNSHVSARLATGAGAPVGVAAMVRYGDSRTHFPTDGSGVPVDSNQYSTERQLASAIAVRRTVGGWAALHLRGGWSRTEDRFLNRPDHPGDSVGFAFAARRAGRVDRSTVEARVALDAGGPVAATVGLQYEDERQRQRGATTSNFGGGPFTEADAFRAARSTRAAFGEVAFDPADAVTLTGGGRIDHNSAFGRFLTWRLGATVAAGRGLRLRAQAGRAFKAPTFAELFAETPFEVGDPGLRPERARSWEVGADQVLAGGRLQASVAWFDQRFQDLIQYAYAGPDLPTYGNVAAVSSHGLEASVAATITPTITASAQVTALRTRVTDAGGGTSPAFRTGERLIRRPALAMGLGLRWQPTEALGLRAHLHHLGPRDDVDFRLAPAARVTLPSRITTDLSLNLGLARLMPGLGLVARVENLFDARWEQAVGFPGRGRLGFLGLTAHP